MRKTCSALFRPAFGKFSLVVLASVSVCFQTVRADDPPPTPEDLEREASIQRFTEKQIAADYGPKFEQAAKEFGVPVDVLMSLSFSETRHEHLMWPEGEKYNPDNGMPRPYGIMSLWDNEHFGYSLLEAAKLIGLDPEVLKKDPLQNMRGAAALLKKYYDETPKPEFANDDSLQSWYNAMQKYSGLPEPDLAAQHAFDAYDFLVQGYDQYGIKLPQIPDLELEAMWAHTKKIKEEQRKINEAKWRAEGKMDDDILEEFYDPNTGMYHARVVGKVGETNDPAQPSGGPKTTASASGMPAPQPVVAAQEASGWKTWALIGLCVVILGGLALAFRKKEQPKAEKK